MLKIKKMQLSRHVVLLFQFQSEHVRVPTGFCDIQLYQHHGLCSTPEAYGSIRRLDIHGSLVRKGFLVMNRQGLIAERSYENLRT